MTAERHVGLSEESLPLMVTLDVAREVERLGFDGMWNTENSEHDAFVVSALWGTVTSRITLGTGTIPVTSRLPHAIAMAAMTLQESTNNRYVLSIGYGWHMLSKRWGADLGPPISAMTDYLHTIKEIMKGEPVHYRGKTMELAGDRVHNPFFHVPPAPVYLAALGKQMLALSGRLADGVLLNWTNEERLALARDTIAAAAERAGRDPSAVKIAGYIRVSVDEDADRARRAVADHMLKFWTTPHYTAQFVEMGFGHVLERYNAAKEKGGREALIEAMPDDFLSSVAAWGKPADAAKRFSELSDGLDIAIARVVPSRPGPESVRDVVRAVAPVPAME